jgi:uncharacterized integral membrane protein
MIVVYLLMAVVGAAAALFAIENRDPVTIHFFFRKVAEMPLALVILLSLMVGMIFAWLSTVPRYWRLRFRVRQLEHQLAELRAQLPQPPPGGPKS